MVRRAAHRARMLILAAIVALGTVLASWSLPGAHALEGRLEFSTDGTSWSSSPPESLFGSEVVLVPGGSASATLHLRSVSPTAGVLDVALTDIRFSGPEAAQHFGLSTITDSGIGLPRTSAGDLADYTSVGPQITLEPGQSTQFSLTIDLEHRDDGTGGQKSAVGLNIAIAFHDALGAGDVPGDEELPRTPSHETIRLAPHSDVAERASEEDSSHPLTAAEPRDPRGLLAVTGIDLRTMILMIAMTALGGALLHLVGHREDES